MRTYFRDQLDLLFGGLAMRYRGNASVFDDPALRSAERALDAAILAGNREQYHKARANYLAIFEGVGGFDGVRNV
jgi:hypothetical protein